MKYLLILIFLIPLKGEYPWQEANTLYKQKKFQQASKQFQRYGEEYPTYLGYLSYQAGLCELMQDSLKQAQWLFQQSTINTDPTLKSLAYNALGYIFIKQEKYEEALNYWKLSLKENPYNDFARYNYELCLRRKEKNLPPPKNNQDMNSRNQKKSKNSSKHQDKGDEIGIQQLGLNEVENILEAMENQEKKFIQQLRKRNKTSKAYDGSEW